MTLAKKHEMLSVQLVATANQLISKVRRLKYLGSDQVSQLSLCRSTTDAQVVINRAQVQFGGRLVPGAG